MPTPPTAAAGVADLLRRQVPALLARLDPAQVSAWGQMTPQHMVEHLAGAVRLSLGRHDLPEPPAGPALDQRRALLLSTAPFPPNVRNPMLTAAPAPLRRASLAAAVAELLLGIEEFFDHYARQPTATAVHPMFGRLDFAQWQAFHGKHFDHHLRQFKLLP